MQQDYKPVKKVVVNMAMPTRKTMRDERRFSGSTKAWSDFKVEPKVSGKLLRLHFDIGDKVKRDALIAEIDDREFRQNVLEAEANLEYAKAKLLEAQGVDRVQGFALARPMPEDAPVMMAVFIAAPPLSFSYSLP